MLSLGLTSVRFQFSQIKRPHKHLYILLYLQLCCGVSQRSPVKQFLAAPVSWTCLLRKFLSGQLMIHLNIYSYSTCPWKQDIFLLYFTSQHWLVMTAHMTPLLYCGKCLSAIHCASVDCTCHQGLIVSFTRSRLSFSQIHMYHGNILSVRECMIVPSLSFHL